MSSTTQHVVTPIHPHTLSATEAYVRLQRPANLVTAAADVITGCAVVGALHSSALGWRIAAGVALYAGGVVLNDYFDRRLDSIERPERPIPSGAVSASSAAALGFALLAAGVGMATAASVTTGLLAAIIAVLVVGYDVVLKHNHLGPVAMGACRALNLTMGLAAAPLLWRNLWWLALLPLVYIAGFTLLSRGEVLGGSRRVSGAALAVFGGVVGALLALNAGPGRLLSVSPFVALLVIRVLPPLGRAYQHPEAAMIRAAVRVGIVSLVILDASLAAGYAGVMIGVGVLALGAVAMCLSRMFAVT